MKTTTTNVQRSTEQSNVDKGNTKTSFGELIIQDGGQKHDAIWANVGGSVIVAVILLGVLIYLSSGTQPRGFIMIGGVTGFRINYADAILFAQITLGVLAAGLLINGAIAYSKISKTSVFVYERGIKGVGASQDLVSAIESFKALGEMNTALSAFQITYNQVASVEIVDKRISVGTTLGQRYVIYVTQPKKIVEAIYQQKEV